MADKKSVITKEFGGEKKPEHPPLARDVVIGKEREKLFPDATEGKRPPAFVFLQ